MGDLYALARAARAEAIRIDTAASERLMAAYGDVYRALSGELDALTARMTAARRAGKPITPAMLYQEGRLQTLRAQALSQLQQAEGKAIPAVRAAIAEARSQAAASAASMVEAVRPPGLASSTIQLPTAAVGQAVAFTSPATPLAALFADIAPSGAAAIERAIVTGVASGSHPRVVARAVKQAIGGNAVRAMTISRTEIMRAHRAGAIETYGQHPNAIRGWVWVAGLGSRTCASCWAMSGTEHPIDEPMASHPRCRCVAAPLSVRWSDLGIDLPEPSPVPYGPDVFARSPAATKRSVLGDAKYEAYRRGEVRLEDFVARRHSPTWGASTSEAGLIEARRNAALRQAA